MTRAFCPRKSLILPLPTSACLQRADHVATECKCPRTSILRECAASLGTRGWGTSPHACATDARRTGARVEASGRPTSPARLLPSVFFDAESPNLMDRACKREENRLTSAGMKSTRTVCNSARHRLASPRRTGRTGNLPPPLLCCPGPSADVTSAPKRNKPRIRVGLFAHAVYV